MKQKNKIKNKEELLDWIEDNFYAYRIEDEEDFFTLQAPRDASVTVCFEKDDDIDEIILKTIERLEDFDADNEFMELWCVDFANHNHFSPSQFIEMLKADERTYNNIAHHLREFVD